MIRDFKVVAWEAPVGQGVTGSRYVTVGGIAKTDVPNAPYNVPNEFASQKIGALLHIPVPPGYVQIDQLGVLHYISLNFNPRGTNLPPVIPPLLNSIEPEVSAGILAFDIFIGNCDRHSGNLAYDSTTKSVAVFDHSHSLFGIQPGYGVARLNWLQGSLGCVQDTDPWGYQGNRHCLIDFINRHDLLIKWAEKIQAMPDFFIHDLCEDIKEAGITQAEAIALQDYLLRRRDNFMALINASQTQFTKIVQWKII